MSKMVSDQIMTLYNILADEESKYIFRHRLLYMLNADYKEIFRIVNVSKKRRKAKCPSYNMKTLDDYVLENNTNNVDTIVILGIGKMGDLVYRYMNSLGFNVKYYGTDACEQKEYNGLQILTIKQIKEIENKKVILAADSKNEFLKLLKVLIHNHISKKEIIVLQDLEKKYFDLPFLKSCNDEVFVDGGALNGKTILDFQLWCNNKYKKIYSFEPDWKSYEIVEKTIQRNSIKDIELYKIGLWDTKGKLLFNALGTNGSRISEDGNEIIYVDKLDNILKNEKVTYIKLDIEGAELNALKGAEHIIKCDRPKLAISVYKRSQDMLDILLYLYNLVPEYRIYLRHHSGVEYDTILYAII